MTWTRPIGRLAPSPTGAQHLGNARTYLLAWLAARTQGGRLILRIEDIDSPRVKPEAIQQIFDDFRWLGFDWDDGPYFQTQRLAHYESALGELKRRELVYPCTCSRSDVEHAASAPHAEHEGPIYPGTCAHRRVRDAGSLHDRPFSWRVRTGHATYEWHDGFRGPQSGSLRELGGDFVVWKSAGTPAYQLAVVVDDAAMGVTQVVRGDDLIPSTPRQLLLYDALDLAPPSFMHVPLVVGTDGRRLAKRHGDTRLSTLREAGMTAEDLLGWLAWSCGWLPSGQRSTLEEIKRLFDLSKVPSAPLMLRQDPRSPGPA